LAAVAAPLLIGTLVQTGLGWRSVWLLAALSALILAGLGPHGPATPAATPEAQGSRSAKLAFWLFWAALLCAVVLEFGTLFWAADLLRTRLQLPQAQATITASLFVVMMVVGRTSASYLLRWASARALIVASALLTSLGLTLYILVPQPALVLPGFALLGLGVANLYPLMLSQLMRSAPGTTAQAGAYACLASGLAILGGPLLLGWISDRLSLLVAHTTLFVALAGLILAQSIGFRLRRMP
ncbi:MAG: MFS transporter, partial [Oscillochloris sp.]|nr:MFS transporter [Oscillochloris sp.]